MMDCMCEAGDILSMSKQKFWTKMRLAEALSLLYHGMEMGMQQLLLYYIQGM